jgi:hypothetical protein
LLQAAQQGPNQPPSALLSRWLVIRCTRSLVAAGGEGVEAVGGGVGALEGHAFEFVAGAPGVGEEDLAGFGVVTDDEACCGANIVKRVACFECADQASLRRAV